MIDRALRTQLVDAIAESPAVALLGPRQSGKTTLALEVGMDRAALYLDLESEQDRAKLLQAELYLADHQDKLVILDEVHRVPGLFPVLRGLIDRARRAGRIAYLELTPFQVLEVRHLPADELWLRGGFPESLLASGVARSQRWRQDFIRSYLERDIPQFGPRIAAETLLAHPVIGQSWEGFVIENLLACAAAGVQGYFYRTGGGAEIDLLLAWPDGRLCAIASRAASRRSPSLLWRRNLCRRRKRRARIARSR